MNSIIRTYPRKEEKLNIWSHFFGVIISAFGLVLLLAKGIALQSTIHIVSYLIYGASMVALFFASTFYHSSKTLEIRKKRNVFDHIAIYFLIAGTYTPFTLLVLKGTWGWSIFGVVWAIALIGSVFKYFFAGRFNIASTIGYILMGMVIVIAIKPLNNNLCTQGLAWLAIGGISYIVGAILYLIKKMPFNHFTFHIFVLVGAISHYIAVYFYV